MNAGSVRAFRIWWAGPGTLDLPCEDCRDGSAVGFAGAGGGDHAEVAEVFGDLPAGEIIKRFDEVT